MGHHLHDARNRRRRPLSKANQPQEAAMTLSNQERAARCQQALTAYSDDDAYTNLVDFLADAFHWCQVNGHSFPDATETAVMHFESEITSDDIIDDNVPATTTTGD
jgi:hypothetical protein